MSVQGNFEYPDCRKRKLSTSELFRHRKTHKHRWFSLICLYLIKTKLSLYQKFTKQNLILPLGTYYYFNFHNTNLYLNYCHYFIVLLQTILILTILHLIRYKRKLTKINLEYLVLVCNIHNVKLCNNEVFILRFDFINVVEF